MNATTANVDTAEYEEVPRSGIQDPVSRVFSSVVGSPGLSPVVPISSVSLGEGISTPARVFEVFEVLSRPGIQADSPSTILSVAGSPELSLISPISYTDYLQYEPALNKAISQPANTIELSIYFLLSSPTAEAIDSRRVGPRRDISLQLPSEPRQSILSLPLLTMIEEPEEDKTHLSAPVQQ